VGTVTVKVLRKEGIEGVKVDPSVANVAQIPEVVAVQMEAMNPPAVARISRSKLTNDVQAEDFMEMQVPGNGYGIIKNPEGE
jgi:hypothetical protein